MAKPIALLRVSDTEPLRSIMPMFDAAGWDYVLPDREIRDIVRNLGGSNVDEFKDMVRRWGAEPPPPEIREIGVKDLNKCSLYVDVAGCWNGPRFAEKFPHFKGRLLTYFINGGEPRDVEGKGDCRTPATPIMTTAQHYRSTLFCANTHWNKEAFSCDDPPLDRGYWTNHSLSHPTQDAEGRWCCPHGCGPLVRSPWLGKVYVFYPAFTRWDRILPRAQGDYGPPVSFVHNCISWGGAEWNEWGQRIGVKAYGGGSSPGGLVKHEDCFPILAKAVCTVYLKSGGAVDYSILEPMATGCPTTFHTSYAHNCRLYDLLEPGVTCLTWGTEAEMRECIERLKIPAENRRIGDAGRERMKQVCWDKARDGEAFADFMRRMFP